MRTYISKQEYQTEKENVFTNPNLTVSTKSKTIPKKFLHTTTITSELGSLVLNIDGGTTTYYKDYK